MTEQRPPMPTWARVAGAISVAAMTVIIALHLLDVVTEFVGPREMGGLDKGEAEVWSDIRGVALVIAILTGLPYMYARRRQMGR